ncbi:sulfatase-like hydrolase/transferase [Stappia stellulata]|uniref:sulfatase-like hydrolase/transferase n=1 Tax=Stappia stellulata TaxID=71235 RepID=UPI001CD319B3|nr:sulfatase-like hydrolase/transferase [Stappia stellulata]MCA1243398.1 sulfatase-like hydrolase/transferase [Stappia stellulata]
MRKLTDWLAFFLTRIPVVAAVLLAGLAGIAVAERYVNTLPMALSIALAIGCVMALLSGRLVTSIYASVGLIAMIAFISYAKMKWMSVAPNIVDLYYLAFNSGTLQFLSGSFLPYLLVLGGLALGTLIAVVVVRRREPGSRRVRMRALVLLPLAVALAVVAQPRDFKGVEDLMRFRYVTSFFSSLRHLAHLGEEIPLLARLDAEKARPAVSSGPCETTGMAPDLVVVQSESIVVPAHILGQDTPPELTRGFGGADGRTRALRVETFAGNTWVTTAGFNTSLPISDLGWLKNYSNFVLEGRVEHTLARTLKRCGYRTVYLTPLPYSFVNEGDFGRSIGFDMVIDQTALQAASAHQTDDFYYDKVLETVRRLRADGDGPLFVFVLTMSAHSPWDFRLHPDAAWPGEPYAGDGSLAEYFRRVAKSREDLSVFWRQLKGRASSRPVALLEYGDHQPNLLRTHWEERYGTGALASPASPAYLTYFQVLTEGVPAAPAVPAFETLDIQYLAPTLLEAAGLRPSPVYDYLLGMRDACAGRFADCTFAGMKKGYFACRQNPAACATTLQTAMTRSGAAAGEKHALQALQTRVVENVPPPGLRGGEGRLGAASGARGRP